jgi:threonine/homoserine/homoserine lactone efflux protein
LDGPAGGPAALRCDTPRHFSTRTDSMFGIADYGAFCAAILLFLALPGPGTIALITSTGKGGLRAGAAATAGLMLGDQVLLWLAVAGVAALLAAHPAWLQPIWAGSACGCCWRVAKAAVHRCASCRTTTCARRS